MEHQKKSLEQYMWTTSSRLKPKSITDVQIHPNIKPAVLTIHRGNDRRNFDVHNPFKFVDFGVTELDELGPIIENKKNKIIVGIDALLTYLVMASNITTLKNTRFYLKLRKLIEEHLDQEKLQSKKVKLESLGYKLD
ncbi:retrovirus-related pol polyprotein from transposon TNT 1-94 [Tanacetum coccineum]